MLIPFHYIRINIYRINPNSPNCTMNYIKSLFYRLRHGQHEDQLFEKCIGNIYQFVSRLLKFFVIGQNCTVGCIQLHSSSSSTARTTHPVWYEPIAFMVVDCPPRKAFETLQQQLPVNVTASNGRRS